MPFSAASWAEWWGSRRESLLNLGFLDEIPLDVVESGGLIGLRLPVTAFLGGILDLGVVVSRAVVMWGEMW